MSQYAATPPERGFGQGVEEVHPTSRALNIANPDVLGLGFFGFVTVLLGCFYASYTIPGSFLLRPAFGAVLLFGGIVEVLAGMWAFRRNSEMAASIFTAYGGFLGAIGYLFLPTGVFLPLVVVGTLPVVLGLFYLCWTIFTVILWLGVMRTNSIMSITTILLALAFLILTIGLFINDNTVILRIGGWVAIICAIVAWVGVALSVLGKTGIQERLWPMKRAGHQTAVAD
jgi:uncharacterized protein